MTAVEPSPAGRPAPAPMIAESVATESRPAESPSAESPSAESRSAESRSAESRAAQSPATESPATEYGAAESAARSGPAQAGVAGLPATGSRAVGAWAVGAWAVGSWAAGSWVAAVEAAGLAAGAVADVVGRAVAEDLAGGVDVTTVATIPADQVGTADLVARADGVVAGLPVAVAVFELVGSSPAAEVDPGHPARPVTVRCLARDGDRVRRGDILLTVSGPTRVLLTAERSALNLLCQLSGVATLTDRWAAAVAGTGTAVRDTRKTVPGLRALQKYAVRCGGGVNHRMSLSDAALVKDNHVLAAGGVAAAFRAVRQRFAGVPVEVECDSLAEVAAAVEAGADLVLLDNMSTADIAAAVALARPGGVRTEASGGIGLNRAAEVARTGVDYLAIGALTHSAPALDIAMDLRPRPSPRPAAPATTVTGGEGEGSCPAGARGASMPRPDGQGLR